MQTDEIKRAVKRFCQKHDLDNPRLKIKLYYICLDYFGQGSLDDFLEHWRNQQLMYEYVRGLPKADKYCPICGQYDPRIVLGKHTCPADGDCEPVDDDELRVFLDGQAIEDGFNLLKMNEQ